MTSPFPAIPSPSRLALPSVDVSGRVFALAMLGIVPVFLLLTPFQQLDTDMWYHLAGGRHLFETGRILTRSEFSFLRPVREFSNYYWLFQAVIYLAYDVAGYPGLQVFRGVMFALLAWVLALLLRADRGEKETWPAYCLLLAVALMGMVVRETLIRPHLFSYLFIALFLYLFEKKPGSTWLAVPLALVWVNTHGIEYPVMVMIPLAYGAEMAWSFFREKKVSTRRQVYPIFGVLASVLATPFGAALILLPLLAFSLVRLYILESGSMPAFNLLAFDFRSLEGISHTGAHAVIMVAVVSTPVLAFTRRARISHVLLLAGGLALLSMQIRFYPEALLLALPTARAFKDKLLPRRGVLDGKVWGHALYGVAALLLAVGLAGLHASIPPRMAPIGGDLGEASIAYLNSLPARGKVMNSTPGTGGYLQWALDKRYTMGMNLQMSLFKDTDAMVSILGHKDPDLFRYIVKKYNPEFWIVYRRNAEWNLLQDPDNGYVPIFFDDYSTLYVNAESCPEIAREEGFTVVDPWAMVQFEPRDDLDEEAFLKELSRVAAHDPHGLMLNGALFKIYSRRQDYPNAQRVAEDMITHHDENFLGYMNMGKLLFSQGKFQECVEYFRKALDRSIPVNSLLLRNAMLAFVSAGEFEEAYALGEDHVIPTNFMDEDIHFLMGLAAFNTGRYEEAELLLSIADITSPEDALFRPQLEDLLQQFRPR